jgi:hypothetical protein
MTAWSDEELADIAGADELMIAPRRPNGTLQRLRIIWVVRLGAELFVRSVNGAAGAWFRGVAARHAGHISAGGVDADVGRAYSAVDHIESRGEINDDPARPDVGGTTRIASPTIRSRRPRCPFRRPGSPGE